MSSIIKFFKGLLFSSDDEYHKECRIIEISAWLKKIKESKNLENYQEALEIYNAESPNIKKYLERINLILIGICFSQLIFWNLRRRL